MQFGEYELFYSYLNEFPQITKLLEHETKKSALKKFLGNLTDPDGKFLHSQLYLPVQRISRYLLFLQVNFDQSQQRYQIIELF